MFVGEHDFHEENYHHDEHQLKMESCHLCHDQCHTATMEHHMKVDGTEACIQCDTCHSGWFGGCDNLLTTGSMTCHNDCDDKPSCKDCDAKRQSVAEKAHFDDCIKGCEAQCPPHEHVHGPEDMEDECEQCRKNAMNMDDHHVCDNLCGMGNMMPDDMHQTGGADMTGSAPADFAPAGDMHGPPTTSGTGYDAPASSGSGP